MSHTIHEKKKLLNRVRRIRGQVDAIERALEGESSCADVMGLIASSRGAMNGLLAVVLEQHIRTHLVDPNVHKDALDLDAADQLVEIVHSYFK